MKATVFRFAMIVIILISGRLLSGQDVSDCLNSIYYKPSSGFIIRHHPEMGVFSDNRFFFHELAVVTKGDPDKSWRKIYKYPETGVSFLYSEFGGSEIIGKAYGLVPHINFQLKKMNRFSLMFRLGTGLSYFPIKFDRRENFKNQAIGSHVNAVIALQYEMRFNLSRDLFIATGLSLTHFSSGTYQLPNYGINVPAVFCLIGFSPGRLEYSYIVSETDPVTHLNSGKNELRFLVSTGLKEIIPVGGPKFPGVFVSGRGYRVLDAKHKIGTGPDFLYDASDREVLDRDSVSYASDLSLIRFGWVASYGQIIGDLSVILEIGLYIKSKNRSQGVVYDRLSLQYDFSERFFASVGLKTHYAKADFIEWGIGYKIRKSNH